MEDSMTAIGGTLNATYKAMAANVQRSMQMASSVNAMMEQYMCRSVDIETFVENVESNPNEILIHISITSHNTVPLKGCKLKLELFNPEGKKKVPFDVEYERRPKLGTQTPEQKCEMKAKDPTIIEPNFVMQPGSLQWILTLEIKQMIQCNGHIELTFPSIGTGKTLKVEHTFGLYLIHRCRRSWFKNHDNKSRPGLSLSFNGGFLRNFFRVPHNEGITPASAFKLSVAGHSILLPVKKVHKAEVELYVCMLGANFPKEEVVESILLELDMYSKAFVDRVNPFGLRGS
mmetsp:Transcript_4731/g.6712  ORF Transcript_4731/g.6712 Transcript_4731/m.6712 type:complete len:288 (-) Transcript_4731:167-1030(-)